MHLALAAHLYVEHGPVASAACSDHIGAAPMAWKRGAGSKSLWYVNLCLCITDLTVISRYVGRLHAIRVHFGCLR